ncbi:MAG TPA: hypothetical protein VIY54_02430 [Steroidobacteraceae bacterium]
MQQQWEIIGLEDLGIVSIRGSDAVRFLQGQLSCDMELLGPHRSLLAGYHNPQGRVIAVLRLLQPEPQQILAVLPRELAPSVAQRLAKFVLRAKAAIADESEHWLVNGLVNAVATRAAHAAAPDSAGVRALPQHPDAQAVVDGSVYAHLGAEHPDAAIERWLRVSPVQRGALAVDLPRGERQSWRQLDVSAGRAQVYGATSEEFVAQMLNLDALGAVAFDKGCYTGQEVVARAHYRGRVKRRMQRFISLGSAQFAPGDTGQLADGRAFRVVEAVALPDGRCDFLAVAPTTPGEEPAQHGAVQAQPAAMAYPLPE